MAFSILGQCRKYFEGGLGAASALCKEEEEEEDCTLLLVTKFRRIRFSMTFARTGISVKGAF